jgi:phage nucleotide-binding protein
LSVQLTQSTKPTRTSREDSAKAAAKAIKKANEIENFFKMALYARNKVGKTKFACSSPLRTLIIDCNEKGYATVRKQDNVDIYELSKWEQIDGIYWHLKKGDHPYKVIVIDTITMLASIGMRWVLKDDVDRDANKDPIAPSRLSYQKLGQLLEEQIIRFRDLPYHIIFCAQEKSSGTEDEDGNTVMEIHPELSPKPRSVLLSATNLIGRLYVREVEGKDGKKVMQRRMITQAMPKYAAGGRFDELRKIEVNPNLGEFIKRVYGETNA